MTKHTIELEHPGEHRPSLEAINKEAKTKLEAYPKLLAGSQVVSGGKSTLVFDDGAKAETPKTETPKA